MYPDIYVCVYSSGTLPPYIILQYVSILIGYTLDVFLNWMIAFTLYCPYLRLRSSHPTT